VPTTLHPVDQTYPKDDKPTCSTRQDATQPVGRRHAATRPIVWETSRCCTFAQAFFGRGSLVGAKSEDAC
jgi:hypothetical protein